MWTNARMLYLSLGKMDFGRQHDPDRVSFVLPRTPDRSDHVLARGRPDAGPWLRLGAPAWSRRDWLGKLYPRGTTQRDFLRLYSRQVGAIELNASFYAVPDDRTLDGWAAETPAEFRFCPKVPQEITHVRGLRDSGEALAQFAAAFRRLGARLGPALLQLPPWFAPDRRDALASFLAECDLTLAVELRHEGWFPLAEETLDLLERHGAALAITDVTGRRDVCHAALTAPFTLVRFVGNALHPTDETRIAAWLDRLCEWRARGLESAFFFVHQPDDVLAPELLASFSSRARGRGVEMPLVVLGDKQQELF
jgi:uncharacterized protein YecE (DUF72 family)